MAVKSIVTIDVNDDAFKRFYDLFETYSKTLDEMPESWKKLEESMGGAGKTLEGGAVSGKEALALAAAQAGVLVEALENAAKTQNDFGKATNASGKAMDALHKSAKGLWGTIKSISGGIVGIAGALGLGALFSGLGIGALTDAAFTRFRSAGQLGISPGALSSFEVNAQPFLTVSALTAAANAKVDISKAGSLAVLGIQYEVAQRMTTADLAFEELKAARAAYLKNPAMAMQNPAIAAYLALGGSIGDVRNAALNPLSSINSAQAATRSDVGVLGFSRTTAQAWTQLKITLDRAGVTIQTALIDRLAPLAPQIGELSKDIAGFITTFVNSKEFGIVVEDVKKGFKGLVQFLEATDWKGVGDNIKLIGGEILAVAQKLSWLIPQDQQDKYKQFEKGGKNAWNKTPWWLQGIEDVVSGKDLSKANTWLTNTLKGAGKGIVGTITGTATRLGVDPMLALATAIHESGLNAKSHIMDHYANGTPAGYSSGLFQLNEHGEGAGMTLKQLLDPLTNTRRALKNFVIESSHHPNLSPGEIAARAQNPANKAAYAKAVNQIYQELLKTMPRTAPGHSATPATTPRVRTKPRAPVQVSITNSTSSRVAVSVNAAANS